ncbi:MAG: tRNA 2-thiocytidine(32) synthetase TtcA [Clostridiales bacterium]|nr:tRNA 2-thiocytidine(32) synthetase TtcA [Clostridiales bacterium]
MKRLLGAIRKADEEYKLIGAGEKIAVGVSGGKDSLALLLLLSAYRRFAPRPFSLCAITLKIGDPFDTAPIQSLCDQLEVPFHLEEMDLIDALRREKNPCSLCARLRRGTLDRAAAELGCTALALGHHREDAVETWLMSALSEGRFYHLAPKAQMERAGIQVIRPLIDVKEAAIADLCRRYHLPVIKNPCPVDGHTRRAEIKDLLADLEGRFPGAKEKLSAALKRERMGGDAHENGPTANPIGSGDGGNHLPQ